MGYESRTEMMCMKMTQLFLSTSLMCSACANSTYLITSTPTDANVNVTYANGTKQNLGKTPLNGTSQTVNPSQEAFSVEVSKEGFEKQTVFVPGGAGGKDVTLNVTLPPSTHALEGKKTDEQLNAVAASVADVQRDIQAKNYDIALSKINRLIAENPGVSTFYSLSGNIHYLEKRLDKALVSYKRALELDPKSTELARLVDKLEEMKGVSR